MVRPTLPKNVTAYADRHGKTRYRWRKAGFPTHHFTSTDPDSADFARELAAARDAQPVPARGAQPARPITPGSFDDLISRLYRSTPWLDMTDSSRETYGGIIERWRDARTKSGKRHGELPVAAITTAHIDRMIAARKSTPAAANNLRKALNRLMRLAVKLGWRADNPVTESDKFRPGKGWHTMTEGEIAQFRAHWANGTMARAVLEIGLNTAARRANLASLRRDSNVDGDLWVIEHVKGGEETFVTVTAEARQAIDALPMTGIGHIIVNIYGRPFSVEGLGNAWRKWASAAGVPQCSLHSLRFAASRRLAEAGATDAEGGAVTSHVRDRTFAHYRRKANRRQLAAQAMEKVANLAIPENGEPS